MTFLNLIYVYLLDLFLGDPEWFPHPVRGMGKLITFLDGKLRGGGDKKSEKRKGMILAIIVIGASCILAYSLIALARKITPILGDLVWIYLGYTTLSINDLRVKATAIYKKVRSDSIFEARNELSKIVSRDTRDLTKDRIIIAAIESIAENINDGIVAPLFYLALGGPVLAIAYKSINTLDSMIGYKNKEYNHFGRFSAKLDDIVNFIPARISGLLIALSSLFTHWRFKESFAMLSRDGHKHPSPNSGISEAAMAGALGVKLGGSWSYQDKVTTKPYIGEDTRALQPTFIYEALNISFITSLLMLAIGVILKCII